MTQDGLWLRWEDVVYDVPLPDAKGDAPTSKRILHGVSGQVLPGGLVAVMGASGSGKTSLLKLLAGRRQASSGVVLVNGAVMDTATYRRASGFVAQTSVFLDTLTVRETVTTTALLRLDRSVLIADKVARAEEVLLAVDLTKCANSRIGNDLTGGISGGERRRLSIAVETVHKPRLLLLDEPTSGLDATSAQMVGDTLRRMSATDGTSSCTTIHQPRASLLAVFDTLLLLAEGRVMYFGPTGLRSVSDGDGVLEYFNAAGYSCPPMENPADWLLDLMQCADGADGADGADVEIGVSRARLAQSFADTYAASPLASAAMVPLKNPPSPLPPIGKGTTLFPTSWAMQFAVLWRRTMLYKLREPAAVMTQFSMAVVMPLLVGGIFWGITNSQAAVSDRLAAVSFLILLQSFMCMDQILLFPKERAVYLRDHAVGLHSTSSFFVARSLAEMPFILLFAAISATISYWMYGFQRDAEKFFIFVAIICAVTEAGAALLASVGAMSETMEVGNLLATLFIVILTLLDGFYRNLGDVPLWCRWISSFSFLKYGVQAAAFNEFSGLEFTCTPEEALTGCIPDGNAYLRRLGMADINIGANIGYTLVIAVGSRFVAYCALRFLYTGQTFRERLAQP